MNAAIRGTLITTTMPKNSFYATCKNVGIPEGAKGSRDCTLPKSSRGVVESAPWWTRMALWCVSSTTGERQFLYSASPTGATVKFGLSDAK
jgi:hypothetical protein